MPALNQKITHWRGDTRIITLGPVKDKAGNLIDLTGARARWWMGKSVSAKGGNVWIQKSNDTNFGGLEITNPSSNPALEWYLVVTLLPIDTENLHAGSWFHEAEVTDSNSNVSTVTQGPFVLNGTLIPDYPDVL